MSRVTAKLLFFVVLFLISSDPVFAIDPNATGSAVVSATISGLNAPILIAPSDNSATKNPREQISWKRPSPLFVSPLHHYDVYLDGQVFAASVSDSITSQTYYFYTIQRINDTFYLDFNTDLTQGYHTWRVVVFNDAGSNAGTGDWSYYIDSVAPFITLQKVDRQTLNWSTTDSTTIPDVNHRDLTVTSADPLLTGSVERYANMQITLLCPANILTCHDQIYQGNYPLGDWRHRFYNLTRGLTYTVSITTTDAGGNSTIFPEFYLTFGSVSPTPSATITPVPTTPPEISPTVTPTPEIEIVPTPFIPVPPAVPTPPIFLTATPISPQLKIENWLIILLVFGLPLHLFMAFNGTKTRFTLIHKFLFILFFPFLGKKDYQTVPFATIDMFDPDKLDSVWQSKVSDIKGSYSLASPLINKIFIKITSAGRFFRNIIIDGAILPKICLFPILDDPETPPNRLRRRAMTFRSLPLAIACLTSGLVLILQPNYFYLIYLYLSLQLVFSEYLYPHLSK